MISQNRRQYNREYYQANKGRWQTLTARLNVCFNQALYSNKKFRRYPLDFSITRKDVRDLWDSQAGICALTGLVMTIHPGLKCVSLDRIDNTKGYVVGNIQLVCQFANLGKGQHSNEEFKAEIEELNGRCL